MFSLLHIASFPLRPLSASLSSHDQLYRGFSQESLSRSLMPSNFHFSWGLAIEMERLCHGHALLALVCSNVGGHWRPASVLGIPLHPACRLEGQKGDLGGIRRAVP